MGLVDAFRKLLAKPPCLAKSRGLAVLRPDYHTVSLFFSPLYFWLTVSSSPPCLLCLAPLNINHRSLVLIIPLQDGDLWEYHFVIFYHTTGVYSGQAHRIDLPGPRTVDVTCSPL